ncbi:BlaI/MecI/CopY family transcriptional regulator [Streptomyces europaeiscabiei]|uniref:BlaI/MecI/CopY family transcriptional regulator n=1 Tax=Streptomyces europaeiscabiei TaxID=146819 RepID=UPI0029A2BE3F|nr:BlaI/MecI/CopY family transcriptional regulator [Streptomyces europaeiscabiei]MDX3694721.1 BlaI/MecI/CopY family transcriptional regulator [Streptomyces europaeiscabiei]
MSEAKSAATELKTQYAAQVTADLERNAKEQERISAEVSVLQEKLSALQRDHALLVNLQQALSGEIPAVASPGSGEIVPPALSVPQQASTEPTPARQKKAAASKAKRTLAKSSDPQASTTGAQPTLVELIRNHLGQQPEPRSSAEITSALAQAHPDRDIKPKVVRTTVEGLVAKGHVHRSKQGSSVFYTASEPSETAPAKTSPEQKDLVTA